MLVAVPLVALAADVVIQLTAFRVQGRRDPWGSVFLGFVGGLVVAILGSLAAIGTMDSGDSVALVLMNAVSFAALGYGYFNFVNLHLTSLRVRLLRELIRFETAVTREQLLGAYDAQQALMLRLNRLLEKQQLTEHSGRYYVERMNSFLVAANILDFLKWLLFGRPLSRPVNTR